MDRSKGLVPPVAVASTTTDVALAEKQRRKDETKRNIERKKEKKLLANSERALQRELAGLAIPERIKVPSSLPLSAEAAKDIENGMLQHKCAGCFSLFRVYIASDTQAPVGLEHTHVFDVYNQIALHWHHTRGIRKVYWHRVKQFLDELPKGTLLADVGSGDGKYFGINPGVVSIGCDRSEELLGVSWSTEFETLCCDAVQLPYRESTFDAAICIAVMHHLATVPRRLALLREIIRIVTPGGFVVVQAWAQEQGESSKRTFESQDVLVPWQLQSTFSTEKGSTGDSKVEVVQNEGGPELINTIPGNNTTKIYQRYCHVYRKGEIEELCGQIQNCTVVETGWDKGNWFVKLCKRL